MANPITTVHDARTGFHDISPLPQFTPAVISLGTILLFCVIIGAVALFYILRQDTKKLPPLSATVTPLENTLAKLHELEAMFTNDSISLKDIAGSLSLYFREYLQAVLAFPAEQRTPKEIADALTVYLRLRLPQADQNIIDETGTSSGRLLRRTEELTYAPLSTSEQLKQNVSTLCNDIVSIIKHIDAMIEEEKLRVQKLLSESSKQGA